MRKLALVLITVFALCLFAVFAVAQTPGGTTGVNQQDSSTNTGNNPNSVSNSTTNSSAPVTGSATDPYSVNSGPNGRAANSANGQSSSSNSSQTTTGSMSSSNASNNGSATALEGCVVKDKTDYFIQPASGERERLTGSQDLSSSVGKHVRVEGSEQNSTASATGPNTGSTASNQMPNSVPGSSETQTNAAGSIAGNAGSPNATGTTGTSGTTGSSASSSATSNSSSSASNSSNGNWTGKDFLVTKVETVSETCPSDIQNKINHQTNGSSTPQ